MTSSGRRPPGVIRRSMVVAGLALVPILAAAVVAQANEPTADADADVLVGRWVGSGYLGSRRLDSVDARLTLDFSRCAAGVCGRIVDASSKCSDVVVEIGLEAGKGAASGPAVTGHVSFRGQLRIEGGARVAIGAHHLPGSSPRRLLLREADVPLYSRRLSPVVNVSVEHQGPPACEPSRTS